MLITIFDKIPDKRRKEGQLFKLSHILFFSVLATLSGANSYRSIHTYIKTNYKYLRKYFDLKNNRIPCYTSIRYILHKTDSIELEKALRDHSRELEGLGDVKVLSLDGKTLRGSFDNLHDKAVTQLFSAFSGNKIVIAHEEIEDHKTNEIPVAQQLIKDLNISGYVFTFDALHCQKKH